LVEVRACELGKLGGIPEGGREGREQELRKTKKEDAKKGHFEKKKKINKLKIGAREGGQSHEKGHSGPKNITNVEGAKQVRKKEKILGGVSDACFLGGGEGQLTPQGGGKKSENKK